MCWRSLHIRAHPLYADCKRLNLQDSGHSIDPSMEYVASADFVSK